MAGAAGGAAAKGPTAISANNIQAIQALHEPIKHVVLTAFAHAIDDVFLVGVPFVVVGFLVSLLLKEIPLRQGAVARPAAE